MQIVTELLQAMQTLLDRVSALEMMLHQKPVVSGRYTSAPYHNVLQSLEPISTAVTESTVQLGALTAELLSERCSNATLEAVQGQIQQLEHQRYVMQGYSARLAMSIVSHWARCVCSSNSRNNTMYHGLGPVFRNTATPKIMSILCNPTDAGTALAKPAAQSTAYSICINI